MEERESSTKYLIIVFIKYNVVDGFPKKSVLHLYALASLALDYTVTPKSKQMLFLFV